MRTARDRVASPHFLFLEVTGLVLIPVLPFDSGAPRLPLNRGGRVLRIILYKTCTMPFPDFSKAPARPTPPSETLGNSIPLCSSHRE